MNAFIKKLLKFIPSNIGALVGIVQTIVKFVHEVAVLAIRLICPIIPGDSDERIIQKIADITEKIDDILENIKDWLLEVGSGD